VNKDEYIIITKKQWHIKEVCAPSLVVVVVVVEVLPVADPEIVGGRCGRAEGPKAARG